MILFGTVERQSASANAKDRIVLPELCEADDQSLAVLERKTIHGPSIAWRVNTCSLLGRGRGTLGQLGQPIVSGVPKRLGNSVREIGDIIEESVFVLQDVVNVALCPSRVRHDERGATERPRVQPHEYTVVADSD